MEPTWRFLFIVFLLSSLILHTARSEDEIKVFVESSSFQLHCVGEGHLNWNFWPPYLKDNFEDLQPNSTDGGREHRGRAILYYKPQRFVLKFNSSQLEDSGSYMCFENGTLKNTTHLFIHDEDGCSNNLIPLRNSFYDLNVSSGQDFIIPCRATRPNTTLTLTTPHNDVIVARFTILDDHSIPKNQSDSAYDPARGFLFKNANLRDHVGFWICEAKYSECDGPPSSIQAFTVSVPELDNSNKPYIVDEAPKTTQVGEQECITCEMASLKPRKLQWLDPKGKLLNSVGGRFGIQESDGHGVRKEDPRIYRSVLQITNINENDEGDYVCYVMGHRELNATIKLDLIDKRYINLTTERKDRKMNEEDLEDTPEIKWVVTHYLNDVTIKWFKPNGAEIKNNKKFSSTKSTKNTKQQIFQIFNLSVEDAGVYTVEAFNKNSKAQLNLTLVINFKPRVRILGTLDYYKPGTTYEFECDAAGYPPANITWDYKCLEKNKTFDCEQLSTLLKNKERLRAIATPHQINITTDTINGVLSCKACNMKGCGENKTIMIISEFDQGTAIYSEPDTVYEGDNVQFTCYVPKYPCERKWEYTCQYNDSVQPTILNTRGQIKITNSKTQFSHVSQVSIKNVGQMQNGIYNCIAKCTNNKEDLGITQSYKLVVNKVVKLSLRNQKVKLEQTVTEGTVAELDCEADSDPPPSVQWKYKNEIVGKNLNLSSRYSFSPRNMTLKMIRVLTEDEGEYECQLTSRNSTIVRKFSVAVKSKKWSPVILIPIAIILVLLLAVVLYLWRAVNKEKQKVQRLTAHEVKLFLEGATENIDLNLALDQQADLLPYNPNYEYPRENLKLGRQLGSGAFGRVVRGEASTPLFGATQDFDCPSEESDPQGMTIVAVKMVKPNAELCQIKALMTELKILIHVGKHLNVVNLLGACTSNLCNKELLVIVEYCRYGNLHTYLLKQRDNYVDQVNHLKDTLDFTIGTNDDDEGHYENHSVIMEQKQVLFKKETRTIIYDPQPDLERYHGEATSTTDGSTVTEHWTTKYRSDFKGELKRITTKDLVCWSYQVARGMQYLASRRIVHADLAARNILLSEHNVVKICDFGLARNLYNEANYHKKGDDPLPVKWMAIESIQDRIFSTESDVWSFGVVLWEFFTLAKTPYPGIPLDEHFLGKLITGYRMEKPQYSTLQIYKIMRKCWDINASKRPNFNDLVNQLGQILDDNVKQFYIELSGPYIRMNSMQHEYENEIRVSMMKEPTARKEVVSNLGSEMKPNMVTNPSYMVIQTATAEPGYINIPKSENNSNLAVDEPEGYLKMSPVMPKGDRSTRASRESSVHV